MKRHQRGSKHASERRNEGCVRLDGVGLNELRKRNDSDERRGRGVITGKLLARLSKFGVIANTLSLFLFNLVKSVLE